MFVTSEDEIILIEHLPGRRVHLQDFFWSDAKDAPPWVDANQGLTFYETRTVHHTVTLYSPAEDKDNHKPFPDHAEPNEPKCTTCIEPTPRLDDDTDQNIGVLIGEDPGPRYVFICYFPICGYLCNSFTNIFTLGAIRSKYKYFYYTSDGMLEECFPTLNYRVSCHNRG